MTAEVPRAYTARSDLRLLYPPLAPHRTGMLQVDEIRSIYYDCSGNQLGSPAVYLHGGPGAGCEMKDNQWFDPKYYNIVTFDQRGCGRSKPKWELRNNTSSDLVEDLEKLRKHLQVGQWLVFGGSWGSTLTLLYTQAYPDRISALILRGIFTFRQWECDSLYQRCGSTSLHFPDAFEEFEKFIPQEERKDMIAAYSKRLNGFDKEIQAEAALRWII